MKLFYICWIFVLISSASSGIIFLISACERIPGPISNRLKTEVIDNITLRNVDEKEEEILLTLRTSVPKVQLSLNDKTEQKQYFNKRNDLENKQNTFEKEVEKNEAKSITMLMENLTQQPNLSQGISETGQAVILTLVDTASLELQNLAEPHFSSDDYSQISPSNLSQSTSFLSLDSNNNIDTSSSISKLPSTSAVNFATVDLNETSFQHNQNRFSQNSVAAQDDQVVVVVRAEQKTIEDSTSQPTRSKDSQTNEEVYKNEEGTVKSEDGFFSASGELGQGSTVRTKLVSGNSDEAATVVLDGFIGSGSSEHHEDIPSFSEWAQKRLEEAEKKKSHPNASLQNPGTPSKSISGMKVRSKNYASPDCGAKIVAVNPEARSARNVLVSTRDEYMLNTCTSRIWFVVELCEAIQAKKIELANFELFSSSPKDFSVFVSDRFPTREWSPVGQFTAKDERDIQSFTLYPHLFGKFIKFELFSHYGSEHFCPISLFRAYGTSEFEVLETETEIQEPLENEDNDDDDQVLDGSDSSGDDTSKNLFGSARDAVIRIVKKAAEVLTHSGDSRVNNMTQIQTNINDNIQGSFKNCMTLRYIILCNNCTDDQFAKVFQLLSCRASYLDSIVKISFFSKTLYQSKLCELHGIDLSSTINKNTPSVSRKKARKKVVFVNSLSMSFITSIFSTEYIIAFCNVLVGKNKRLDLNSTTYVFEELTKLTVTTNIITSSSESFQNLHKIFTTCLGDPVNCKTTESSSTESKHSFLDLSIKEDPLTSGTKNSEILSPVEKIKISETIASQIKPTKTLNRENIKRESSVPVLEPSKDSTKEIIQADVVTTPSPLINSAIPTLKIPDESSLFGIVMESTVQMTTSQISSVDCEVKSNTAESPMIKNDGESLTHDIGNSIKVEEKEEKLKDNEDIKLNPQEQLSLDSLLSDLKDLENDTPMHGSSVVTHSAIASTPQQKESVFLRLSNRIKTLERNMSLSSQYLEELSRRYKKQVEELQRSLERATVAMSEEFKKSEEKEIKRLEEIAVLREIVSSLSQSVEVLMYDKDSWRSKLSTFGQHIALIFIEITIFILIISYCRRSSDSDPSITSKATVHKEISRRKSAESVASNVIKKKKRRPSEIASRIGGTFRELMIDEKYELKKEKWKKDFLTSNSNVGSKKDTTKFISSRKFLTDHSNFQDMNTSHSNLSDTKSDSVSDSCSSTWLNQLPIEHDNNESDFIKNQTIVEELNAIILPELPVNERQLSIDNINSHNDTLKNNSPRGINIFKNARLHSPSFMKTALCTRSKREKLKTNESQSAHQILDNWEWYSRASDSSRSEQDSPLNFNVLLDPMNINGDITNPNEHNRISENVASEHSILISGKKVKKEGSLRKMVKKLF